MHMARTGKVAVATPSTTEGACVSLSSGDSSVHSRQKATTKVQLLKGKDGFVSDTLPKPAKK